MMKIKDDTIIGIILTTVLFTIYLMAYAFSSTNSQQIDLVQEMETGLIQNMQSMNDDYISNLSIVSDSTVLVPPHSLTVKKVNGPGQIIPK